MNDISETLKRVAALPDGVEADEADASALIEALRQHRSCAMHPQT